jgi:hypothetical protein
MTRIEELSEIFNKYNIGLKDLCLWFIHTYPDDIFRTKELDVVQIREACKRILEKINDKR